MNAGEVVDQVARWCGEHGKASAVIVAVIVGVIVGGILF